MRDNFELAVKYLNELECKNKIDDTIEFLESNNIDHIWFESIEDLFTYYDEDDYTCLSGQCLIFKNGNIIKIV